MKSYLPAILVAGAILAIAVLAVVDIVPEKVAQFAPAALLALFPGAWLGRNRCARAKG